MRWTHESPGGEASRSREAARPQAPRPPPPAGSRRHLRPLRPRPAPRAAAASASAPARVPLCLSEPEWPLQRLARPGRPLRLSVWARTPGSCLGRDVATSAALSPRTASLLCDHKRPSTPSEQDVGLRVINRKKINPTLATQTATRPQSRPRGGRILDGDEDLRGVRHSPSSAPRPTAPAEGRHDALSDPPRRPSAFWAQVPCTVLVSRGVLQGRSRMPDPQPGAAVPLFTSCLNEKEPAGVSRAAGFGRWRPQPPGAAAPPASRALTPALAVFKSLFRAGSSLRGRVSALFKSAGK